MRFVMVALMALLAACGKTSVTPDTLINAQAGVAIKGYDPVAYHSDGKPIKGNPAYHHAHDGAVYQFASAAHRDAFAAMPETYVPAYGGYCAYAMSLGRVVDINPKNWAVVEGQLYLNANSFAQTLWSFDKAGRIRRADAHWQRLSGEALTLPVPKPDILNASEPEE